MARYYPRPGLLEYQVKGGEKIMSLLTREEFKEVVDQVMASQLENLVRGRSSVEEQTSHILGKDELRMLLGGLVKAAHDLHKVELTKDNVELIGTHVILGLTLGYEIAMAQQKKMRKVLKREDEKT